MFQCEDEMNFEICRYFNIWTRPRKILHGVEHPRCAWVRLHIKYVIRTGHTSLQHCLQVSLC